MIVERLFWTAVLGTGLASASTITIANNGSTVFFQETTGTPSAAPRSLGQTFVVPAPTADNLLTRFDFFLASGTDSGLDYQGYIFQWDSANTRAIGPALFQSATQNGSQAASFTGLSLLLNPALQYIALITTQGVANNSFSNGLLNHNSGNVYAGGQAYSQTSAVAGNAGVGTWTTAAWTAVNGNTDFQFSAVFSPAPSAPEPGTLGLVGIAVGAFVLSRRRRAL